MVKNRLQDLRNHLFETIDALKDEDKPMDIDRARAVAEVAKTIIDSAKVELQFIDLTGQETKSDFMGPAVPDKSALPGTTSVTSISRKAGA